MTNDVLGGTNVRNADLSQGLIRKGGSGSHTVAYLHIPSDMN